ncbi:MAG TPA: ABC transporter permease [Euzebyales bacterium]|nr:ABC transporter permease [Euzebyales bacterium]
MSGAGGTPMTVSVTRLLLPAAARGGRRAPRVMERNFMAARRSWFVFLSGFVEPVFYLLAIDIGLGQLVGEVTGPAGQPLPYTAFAAPALLAASAMNGAVYESTFNIFFRLRYGKLYDAMLSTPLTPIDIALGEIGWSQVRGLGYACAFMSVMGALGLIASPWAVLAVPAAILLGFAFGAAGLAAVTFMRSWVDLDMVNLALLPLFLFSATFYPLEVYPRPLQLLINLSPLYHGVELIRSLTLGVVHPGLLGHVAFLLAMAFVGAVIAARRLHRQLAP